MNSRKLFQVAIAVLLFNISVTVGGVFLFVFSPESALSHNILLFIVAFAILQAVLLVWMMLSLRKITHSLWRTEHILRQAIESEVAGNFKDNINGNDVSLIELEAEKLARIIHVMKNEKTDLLEGLERRFQVVLEGVSDGIVILDSSFNVVSANRVARDVLRVTTVDDSTTKEIRSEQPGEKTPETLCSKLDLADFEKDFERDSHIFQPHIIPLSKKDGRVEGYLIIFLDVTEKRRFEESRIRFLSMLSHQLKTPMTSLTMSVSLLNEKLTGRSPEDDELIKMAKSDCDSLSSLITELIGASRDTTANLSLSLRRDDIASVLSSTLKSFQARAERKNIRLKHESDSPIFAEIDPLKFSWVVANIVANAIRCTDTGGEISILLEPGDDDAVIRISDTGPGISKENLGRLFKPFVSLDEQPEPDSMGLGLVIAKEIVEAHNGTIDVESEPGAGTTFVIRLPLA